jgi:hypothetical protein
MLVARAQLDLITEPVARFQRDDGMMRPVINYHSRYIAIIALLCSVSMSSRRSTAATPPGATGAQKGAEA